MKQAVIDVFTSALVLGNYFFPQILSFVPVIFYPNFLIVMMNLQVSALIIAIALMIAGALLDILFHWSRMGSILVILVHAFAYWTVTPNVLLLAVFIGVITFGQIFLRE